jgi:hypothetical protein
MELAETAFMADSSCERPRGEDRSMRCHIDYIGQTSTAHRRFHGRPSSVGWGEFVKPS